MPNAQANSASVIDVSMNTAIKSAFYIGQVFHKRVFPKAHQFTYPLYMNFIDLDEVELLEHKFWWFSAKRWAPLQLKANDYFKHEQLPTTVPKANTGAFLKTRAIAIADSLGANVSPINRVCMLAQLRCFGIYFSPVNFFFLYENETAKYLVAEVSNTP